MLTEKVPRVSVPVLSNTAVLTRDRTSIKSAPLTRIPEREKAPMPPKKPSGTDTTSAQGQEITKKTRDIYIHCSRIPLVYKPAGPPFITSGGITAIKTAASVTIGVYT